MGTDRGGAAGAAPAASLLEISRVLEETARIVRAHALAGTEGTVTSDCPNPSTRRPVGAPEVRAILEMRAHRHKCLGIELTDAAWAMVLELYAARLEGRLVYQTRLGVDAGVPQTTALNIVRRMRDLGLFVSSAHPDDKRLLVLGLSDEAAGRLAGYLAAARAFSPFLC